VLVEVLGADDRPEWDTFAVASQYRLRTRFPRAAEADAERHHAPGAAERRGRLDLRDRLTFTIDPEDARDHDDALSVEAVGHAGSHGGPGSPGGGPNEARW
jgi:ribonuclease R